MHGGFIAPRIVGGGAALEYWGRKIDLTSEQPAIVSGVPSDTPEIGQLEGDNAAAYVAGGIDLDGDNAASGSLGGILLFKLHDPITITSGILDYTVLAIRACTA